MPLAHITLTTRNVLGSLGILTAWLVMCGTLHAEDLPAETILTVSRLFGAREFDTEPLPARQWSKRSQNYGSKHIDEKPLAVVKATLHSDGKTVRLDLPDLAPTWGMEIKYRLTGTDGRSVIGVIHNTIHDLKK